MAQVLMWIIISKCIIIKFFLIDIIMKERSNLTILLNTTTSFFFQFPLSRYISLKLVIPGIFNAQVSNV